MIELMDPAAVVEHDVTLVGRISRSARQVDVLVSGSIGGQAMSIAIECKRYAKRLGIGKVDEFAGKLLDLGVDRGVLYSANGATGPAVDRAKYAHQPGIVLQEMLGQNPEPPKWSPTLAEFTGFGDCPNDNCYTGDIGWQEWPQPSDETVEAGSCDMCGTWAVRCPTCATKTSLFTSTVGCEGCEREFELLYDRKGSEVERVVVT
jgi:restriction endonuclease